MMSILASTALFHFLCSSTERVAVQDPGTISDLQDGLIKILSRYLLQKGQKISGLLNGLQKFEIIRENNIDEFSCMIRLNVGLLSADSLTPTPQSYDHYPSFPSLPSISSDSTSPVNTISPNSVEESRSRSNSFINSVEESRSRSNSFINSVEESRSRSNSFINSVEEARSHSNSVIKREHLDVQDESNQSVVKPGESVWSPSVMSDDQASNSCDGFMLPQDLIKTQNVSMSYIVNNRLGNSNDSQNGFFSISEHDKVINQISKRYNLSGIPLTPEKSSELKKTHIHPIPIHPNPMQPSHIWPTATNTEVNPTTINLTSNRSSPVTPKPDHQSSPVTPKPEFASQLYSMCPQAMSNITAGQPAIIRQLLSMPSNYAVTSKDLVSDVLINEEHASSSVVPKAASSSSLNTTTASNCFRPETDQNLSHDVVKELIKKNAVLEEKLLNLQKSDHRIYDGHSWPEQRIANHRQTEHLNPRSVSPHIPSSHEFLPRGLTPSHGQLCLPSPPFQSLPPQSSLPSPPSQSLPSHSVNQYETPLDLSQYQSQRNLGDRLYDKDEPLSSYVPDLSDPRPRSHSLDYSYPRPSHIPQKHIPLSNPRSCPNPSPPPHPDPALYGQLPESRHSPPVPNSNPKYTPTYHVPDQPSHSVSSAIPSAPEAGVQPYATSTSYMSLKSTKPTKAKGHLKKRWLQEHRNETAVKLEFNHKQARI